ncbi:hypothetical protein B0T09DRAFT_361348 [Sordaria sp. MPI-SDFR-AT-0083]|nr:hypothetical protein B0T09DRAFT_361348 [Sordaria sp. MPI-SDFR-AT-0083]
MPNTMRTTPKQSKQSKPSPKEGGVQRRQAVTSRPPAAPPNPQRTTKVLFVLVNGAEDFDDGDGGGENDPGRENSNANTDSGSKMEVDAKGEGEAKAELEGKTQSKHDKHRRDVIAERWPGAQVEIFDFFPRTQEGKGREFLSPEFIARRARDITDRLQEAVYGRLDGSDGTSWLEKEIEPIPIIFLNHSTGSLLVKKILLCAIENDDNLWLVSWTLAVVSALPLNATVTNLYKHRSIVAGIEE